MSRSIESLKQRLAETDEFIKQAADRMQADQSESYAIMGLEETRMGIISDIYEIEHPGMTLDGCGQPVVKPAHAPKAKGQVVDERMVALFAAIELVHDKIKPGESGTIECPLCGKTMQAARAKSNGHARAMCETKDCLRFIQ